MEINLVDDPIGTSDKGDAVFLKDIWPSQSDIADTIASCLTPEMFKEQYGSVVDGPDEWQQLTTSSGLNFQWDKESTYIQKPPYFDGFEIEPKLRPEILDARVLVYLEDSVTTDHISPAGSCLLYTSDAADE